MFRYNVAAGNCLSQHSASTVCDSKGDYSMSISDVLRTVSFFHDSRGKQFKVGGYRPDPIDPRDKKYGAGRYQPEQLPPMVDLRPHMTEVEQQGELNSCTANAMAGAYEYLAMRQFGSAEYVSRLFIYYNARFSDGTVEQDEGTYLRTCIKVLRTYGACIEKTWPYSQNKVFEKPHEQAYEEAESFLIDDAERIDLDLYAMRHCLAEGYPFAFGLQLFSSFEQAKDTGRVPIPNSSTEKLCGGHAMLCVGYSDQDRMFLVRNSWGPSWGDQGYCYIPYDYITNSELNGDCWTIKSVTDLDLSQDVWCDEGSFFDMVLSLAVSELEFAQNEDEDESEDDDEDESEDDDEDESEDDDEDESEDDDEDESEDDDEDESEDDDEDESEDDDEDESEDDDEDES
ncbi:MAG: C1 family peptidase, partial [Nostoc sp.]